MPSSRDAVKMSDEELADFLAANLKVQVATVGAGGEPHLSTLFYVLEGGNIAFWTYARSQKILNLRRDPRITCLVEDGEDYFELRGATVTGKARLIEDHDEILALGSRVARRMAGTGGQELEDLGDFGDEIVARQALKRVAVVVEPDRIATWDHRKMTAPPGGNTC